MEKVDKLIEDLADHISGILKRDYETELEIVEKTEVLAELVSARASVITGTLVETANITNNLVEKYVHERKQYEETDIIKIGCDTGEVVEAEKKAERIVELLKEANALVDELASKKISLEMDI